MSVGLRALAVATHAGERQLQRLTSTRGQTFGLGCLLCLAKPLALGLLVLDVLTLEAPSHAVF